MGGLAQRRPPAAEPLRHGLVLDGAATSWALVLTGKALVRLDYGAAVRAQDGADTALPQRQTEAAALAIANDVLAQLG